ncbi:hypothetical protein [Oceanirhabdus sp. W0125-5]|uniref:hypothetical protein n=1 Tax=Oceanirhabdus sp. W0125-5 TaxID=2999116 RepID=UPI0022F2B0F3|nr:hypothetical protein [Oceanirhabdus sp. W0125-5]WBW95454.1 hypothetical protein OW730_17385 [Oceanirhabdus sp. W0125-5]
MAKAHELSDEKAYREHVNLYMYRNPEIFNVGLYPIPDKLKKFDMRLCVDQEKDFELIKILYNRLYVQGCIIDNNNVISLFNSEPELYNINKRVHQKNV